MKYKPDPLFAFFFFLLIGQGISGGKKHKDPHGRSLRSWDEQAF